MRRPVCALFAGALGAQLMAAIEPQATFGPLAALFVGAAMLGWRLAGGRRVLPWLLAGAALGLGFFARTQGRLDDLTQRFGGAQVTLTASVEQVQEGYQWGTVRARLRVTQAGGEAADFCCWCEDLPACAAGEQIQGTFVLDIPDPQDRKSRYADGDAFTASYQDGFVDLGPAAGFRPWTARLQQALSSALCRDLEGDEAGALAAMVAGDSSFITKDLKEAYRAAGLAHVLVVSGMHVTILCGLGLPGLWNPAALLAAAQKLALLIPGAAGAWLYRRLGVHLVRLRMRRARAIKGCFDPRKVWAQRLRALWPVGLAVLLAGITGCTPSVLRAAAAVIIGAAGVWLHAPADALTSLAWAGLGMSALNSYAVWDVGFQLSFAAVAGTLAGVEIARRGPQHQDNARRPGQGRAPWFQRLKENIGRQLRTTACISVCATAATFPILVGWGMSTSPYALVSGVAILWVVQPLMTLGILAALAGMVPALDPVYHLLAAGAGALARLLNGWARMAAGWPGSRFRFDTSYAAVVCLALMGLCWLAWRGKVRPRYWVPAAAVTAALAMGAASWLGRDVIQVSLVGGSQNPSAILSQGDTVVVLYRGGTSGPEAVEQWLESHGAGQPQLVIDLRSQPSAYDQPAAGRVITPAWFQRDYYHYEISCGPFDTELLKTPDGIILVVEAGGWRLGTVSGSPELAAPVAVDWLLASPSNPQPFRWQGAAALGRYGWMDPDADPAAGLLLGQEKYRMLQ